MGGLFQITLFTYSQQGRKSDPQTPQFGELFGSKIDPRSRKSGSEIFTSSRSLIRFLIDFGSILDPTGHPKIEYFSSKLDLGVALGPSWRQEGAQSAPRQLQRSIFQEFGTILGSILKEFQRFPKAFLIQLQS